MKIRSSRLTTCRVAPDGATVGLELIDSSGSTVTVELPFDQAEAVVMTLPTLLTQALRQQTGVDDARYVFGLGEWSLENAKGQACLIATLKTTDGFEVSFGIPFDACPVARLEFISGRRTRRDGTAAATGNRHRRP